jgi:RNA 3'-terminal phosphate cyclase (ATP)
LPEHVAERQAKAAREFLLEKGIDAKLEVQTLRGFSTGSGITIWSGYKGGSALGEKGKRAELVGREAAENFYVEFSNSSAFDSHLADQIMPFAAVARRLTEYTTSKITLHQKSNAYVIEKFLGEVVDIDEKNRVIKIRGRA